MGSAGSSSCIRTLHCSVNNGAVSKGSKARNDTVQSVGCGGLILIWDSLSVAKRPKARGALRK